jgi:DNA-binding PadR family transcriptional regulator
MSRSNHLTAEIGELLPLSPHAFFVLFALADEDKHGYRIMQDVKTLSADRLRMGPATLYTTIQKLSEQGFIEEIESYSGDRRRTYRLTVTGRQLLEAEFGRQSDVLTLAKAKNLFPLGDKA